MGYNKEYAEIFEQLMKHTSSKKYKTSFDVLIREELERIAKDFIDCMEYAVNEADHTGDINYWGISDIAHVLSDLSVKDIVIKGNTATIKIDYNQDLERPSFSGGPVRNIASLLNTGYVTKSTRPIRGEWHDRSIFSQPRRLGAKFIEVAVLRFYDHYPTWVPLDSRLTVRLDGVHINVGDVQRTI